MNQTPLNVSTTDLLPVGDEISLGKLPSVVPYNYGAKAGVALKAVSFGNGDAIGTVR